MTNDKKEAAKCLRGVLFDIPEAYVCPSCREVWVCYGRTCSCDCEGEKLDTHACLEVLLKEGLS